jgi:predicted transposase YdaD
LLYNELRKPTISISVKDRTLNWRSGIEEAMLSGMEKGLAEGMEKVARNMVKMGLPVETIISATQLDPEKVKSLVSVKLSGENA